MIARQKGFTLIELLISMAVFVVSLMLVSNFFTGQLMLFKQQAKTAESNIEGIVGLEALRQDIKGAGYGLLWSYPDPGSGYTGSGYSEATSSPAIKYNDSGTSAPRAILSGNNGTNPDGTASGTLNNSDYIVIKAINVATSPTARKWTNLQCSDVSDPYCSTFSSAPPGNPRVWTYADGTTPTPDNLSSTDKVIVISTTVRNKITQRVLVTNGNIFSVTYGTDGANLQGAPWQPSNAATTSLVYGVDPASTLRVPFNRADYYISRTASTPQRCATNAAGNGGTGVLYKAVLNQSTSGADFTQLPLLDCVADMQVVFGVDTDPNPDGVTNCYTNDLASVLTTYDAANVRTRVREVRVYILVQEGQRDPSFNFTNFSGNTCSSGKCIRVGEPSSASMPGCSGTALFGDDFDLTNIANWQNYRWKVYTLIVTPDNLTGD